MAIRQLTEKIFSVGSIDWDRRLFDELIPLPEGTSYNAYLVKGSAKIALLDAVDPPKVGELLANLKAAGVTKLDYVVAHHGEQDHSGGIPAVLAAYPEAKVVTNAKCQVMLQDLLSIPADKFQVVADGETISLGDKTLKFIYTPWVHWPETMVTYLPEDKILFSCDFFGSHFASSQLFVEDEPLIYRSAKRYYAEIMMPFRVSIRQNLVKLAPLEIKIIAPSHGPVYQRPALIMEAYKDWISDEVKNEVILPYVSMHGSTAKMVEVLTGGLIEEGITVKPYNLAKTDIGELAMDLVDAATVVVGSPTVLVGAHPLAAYAAFLLNALRPKTRYLSVIGSFGWGGKMVEQLSGMIGNLKVELIPPVIIKGEPKAADLAALKALSAAIKGKHQALGLIK